MRLVVGRLRYVLLNMAAPMKMAPHAAPSPSHGTNRFEILHSEEFAANKTQRPRVDEKAEAAPCHRPVRRNVTRIFTVARARLRRAPPSGMHTQSRNHEDSVMRCLRQKSAGERARNPLDGLVHHSERGIRYLSIPYKGGWPGQVCRCRSGVEVTPTTAPSRDL